MTSCEPMVALIVADGVRPDTLQAALAAGDLPALAAEAAGGALAQCTTVFPSVTGPAYVPFLTGWHPGPAGIPGIRWWDRAGARAYGAGTARSYVGLEALRQDGDLDPRALTLFERHPGALAAGTPLGRGLRDADRLGASPADWPRLAWTHFRGDVDGWLRLERALADRWLARVDRDAPRFACFAHQGPDKCAHRDGHDAPSVRRALREVDATVGRLRDDARRRRRRLDLMVTSDHGHEPVHAHEDLAGTIRDAGFGVLAHPWIFAGGDDVAVMVSGNAMAHLYVDLAATRRRWWPALAPRWAPLVELLLGRAGVDLVLLPHGPDACEVRSARGRAMLRRGAGPEPRYEPITGDPLGALAPASPYADAAAQVLALAGSARAGDVIVSAAEGWDLRARHEPVPHVSTHGALRRAQMEVPVLTSWAPVTPPRRTTDCHALLRGRLSPAP